MQVSLIMTGKTKEPFIENGLNQYVKRISKYLSFNIKVVKGVKNAKKMSVDEIKKEEGEMLMRKIPEGSEIILLDERGLSMSSEKFAKWFEKRMVQGGRPISFVIGGAYGFSDEIYKKATYKISLSEMTFSHQLIRLIFAEQLYRALTIIKGEPYHHGN